MGGLGGGSRIVGLVLMMTSMLSGAVARAEGPVNWMAFHDHRPTKGVTHPHASGFDIRATGDGGPLRNFATGEELPVRVVVTSTGTTEPEHHRANAYAEPASPAANLLDGIVDVGNTGTIAVRKSTGSTVCLTFTNLDPAKRYTFSGTSARGGAYADRWICVTLLGADSAEEAHEMGDEDPPNLITRTTFPDAALRLGQVALNSGSNTVGSLVSWSNIAPGADGSISILTEQYTGRHPLGTSNNGPCGYALTAFALQEVDASLGQPLVSQAALPPDPVFTRVQRDGGNLLLEWENGRLQRSLSLGDGTWTDVEGASSPYTAPTTDGSLFFRIAR